MLVIDSRFAPHAWLEDPLFGGHERALRALLPLEAAGSWPSADAIDEVFAPLILASLGRRIRFRPQARREPMRYEATIVVDGEVPTREGSAHDLFNALAWASFPLTKYALHRRFHACEQQRQVPGRTRFQDRLALVDEGAVVRVGRGRQRTSIVFGHAILEHRIGHVGGARADVIDVDVDAQADLADVDRALAADLDTWADPPESRRAGVAVSELFPELSP